MRNFLLMMLFVLAITVAIEKAPVLMWAVIGLLVLLVALVAVTLTGASDADPPDDAQNRDLPPRPVKRRKMPDGTDLARYRDALRRAWGRK